jgi:hypothetical protein
MSAASWKAGRAPSQPGDKTWLIWEDFPDGHFFAGRVTYRDLTGSEHVTQFELEFGQQRNGKINSQRIESDIL